MPDDTIFTWINTLKDAKSVAIKETIARIADLNSNVLIYGETGVGKDVWVKYLAKISHFPSLLDLNCGDVPETLLESEWFGFKRGAFTGADRDYEGKWQQAGAGILFLNQIDLLSLNLQAKLLRIIERKKYYPLGSIHELDLHSRFIFSADFDIERKARAGLFREDLYYRISPCQVFIPPLRERPQDILPLIHLFARQKQLTLHISPTAEKLLTRYPWRGNIREIENFITTASVGKNILTDDDIHQLIKTSQDFFELVKSEDMTLTEIERRYIDYLLRKYKNKARVANILGITRKSLYNKLNHNKLNCKSTTGKNPATRDV